MKLNTPNEIKEFIATVNECEGEVTLRSVYGDLYNLRSALSCYIAIGKLAEGTNSQLELFCNRREDEVKFFGFFNKYPETLR